MMVSRVGSTFDDGSSHAIFYYSTVRKRSLYSSLILYSSTGSPVSDIATTDVCRVHKLLSRMKYVKAIILFTTDKVPLLL